MKQLLIASFLFYSLISHAGVGAKEDTIVLGDKYIYVSPFYAIQSTLRVDYEFGIGKTNNRALVISPMFSTGKFRDSRFNHYRDGFYNRNENLATRVGAGVTLMHKIYMPFSYNTTFNRFYLGHGPSFMFYNIKKEETDWIPVSDFTGFETERVLGLDEKSRNLTRFGYDFVIGLQIVSDGRFTTDAYMGVGMRFSHMKKDAFNTMDYIGQAEVYDFSYSGVLPIFGFRIGVALF